MCRVKKMWGLSGLLEEQLASGEGPFCMEFLLEIHTGIVAGFFVSMSACIVRSSEQTTLKQALILSAVFSYSPQMISRAQRVMYGYTSKPLDPTSFCNLLIRISLFSENTFTKLSRILKWKVGVIIFLWVCHFCPGKSRLKVKNICYVIK